MQIRIHARGNAHSQLAAQAVELQNNAVAAANSNSKKKLNTWKHLNIAYCICNREWALKSEFVALLTLLFYFKWKEKEEKEKTNRTNNRMKH